MSTDTTPDSILRPLADDLRERRAAARLGGGQERIERQHAADKLTARERIALLIDDGTFTEVGIHAGVHHSVRGLEGREAPADGVITGYGLVDGRHVAVCAYDFTVMAGSMGTTGEHKVSRLRALALTKRMPFVWLLDSAGARIQEAVGSLFAGTGDLFRDEVLASGVIPQVAALMGPCAAGTAYIPGLADFVPMVRGRGSMALAGPHLVRAAVGEDVTQEQLGGSRVHCRTSGVGDLEVADDAACIAQIKRYLSFFASHCEQDPPVRACSDPADRRDEELLDVLPSSTGSPTTCTTSSAASSTTATGWTSSHSSRARSSPAWRGWAGGPWGSWPASRATAAGSSTTTPPTRPRASCRCATHSRSRSCSSSTCRASWSARRSRRRGSSATGRRCCTRWPRDRAEGHGRHPQGLRRRLLRHERARLRAGSDRRLADGRDQRDGRRRERSRSSFRKEVEAADDPAAKKAELIAAYRGLIDVYVAARNALIDDVIDPRETRPVVIGALEMAAGKRVERPWKRHGVMPV